MPIVLAIEADSAEEAQKAIDDWSEEVDMRDSLPLGTEDIDPAPEYELNDEGQRVLLLPALEENIGDEDSDMDFDGTDDFSDDDI